MPAMDLFTYCHTDQRKSVPNLQFSFLEKDTGNYWRFWGAADMIYLYRTGEELSSRDDETRQMEADLMVRRLECALLLAKKGIFQFKFASRWKFNDIEFKKTSTVASVLRSTESHDDKMVYTIIDWFEAFSRLSLVRRAAEDAYMASILKSEAIFFTYRGFEWLRKALSVSWDDLGKAIDVPQTNIRYLKKIANDWEAAARHAAESGYKARFEEEVLPSWVYGLLHGIVHTRCKLEPEFATTIQKEGDPWPI